jgi:hypothetical protein
MPGRYASVISRGCSKNFEMTGHVSSKGAAYRRAGLIACPIGGLDRTKTFHVKHFGTIGAGNLTRPRTSGGLETRGDARKFGIFGPVDGAG